MLACRADRNTLEPNIDAELISSPVTRTNENHVTPFGPTFPCAAGLLSLEHGHHS